MKAHLLINFAPVTLWSGARCEKAFPEVQTHRFGSVEESGVIKLSLGRSLSANPSARMQAEHRHSELHAVLGVGLQMLCQMTLTREQICYKPVQPLSVAG